MVFLFVSSCVSVYLSVSMVYCQSAFGNQNMVNVKKSSKEHTVEEQLIRRVKALGGRCEKMSMKGRRGFFDRLVVLPGGRVAFCETKRPVGGVLSPHQIQLHDAYRALDVEVWIIRNSADIDTLLSSG
jgi:hypothetical protein